jgi:hypothetical protein
MKQAGLKFDRFQIAPCGMNCGTCIAFLRKRNKCHGCRIDDSTNLKTRVLCKIKNCVSLKDTVSGFCYECVTFPCQRIRNIDKRYRTKYHTSFIENLLAIRENGIEYFLALEGRRRKCPSCGSVISVHRNNCLTCMVELHPS